MYAQYSRRWDIENEYKTRLLAKGTNPDDGGSEMLYFETDSSGAVFPVESITYPASLLVDNAVSTVTASLLTGFRE